MTERERIEIVQLSDKHIRSEFDCGDAALNQFLHKHAKQNFKKGLSVTYVAVRPGESTILGYYCISNGQVARHDLPDEEAGRLPRYPVPVVRIGRLATSLEARGQGIGGLLLIDALKKSLKVSVKVGVYAVEVDAKTEAAKQFYLQYGFSALLDDSLHLYLSMKTVKNLFGAP
ncbi:GNAT family N-acetyltransferase [bacterium]|nr:GNAT family N-acetyltransferase [bacterium]